MIRVYCDRCHDEIPPDKLQRWPVPVSHPDGWHSRTVDLCPGCMIVLARVLEPRIKVVA